MLYKCIEHCTYVSICSVITAIKPRVKNKFCSVTILSSYSLQQQQKIISTTFTYFFEYFFPHKSPGPYTKWY